MARWRRCPVPAAAAECGDRRRRRWAGAGGRGCRGRRRGPWCSGRRWALGCAVGAGRFVGAGAGVAVGAAVGVVAARAVGTAAAATCGPVRRSARSRRRVSRRAGPRRPARARTAAGPPSCISRQSEVVRTGRTDLGQLVAVVEAAEQIRLLQRHTEKRALDAAHDRDGAVVLGDVVVVADDLAADGQAGQHQQHRPPRRRSTCGAGSGAFVSAAPVAAQPVLRLAALAG